MRTMLMRSLKPLAGLCCVLALASGCIVPRSMMIGQLAAPVGRGATEVGVGTGFIYASQTNPQFPSQDGTDSINTNTRTNGFTIPAFEANLNTGFNEHVALNVHASAAGLQPGLKLTLNKSTKAWVALMPQVAFGYGSLASSTFVTDSRGVLVETAPHNETSFTFMGGLKFLFSHRSGFYAGLGYDFIFNRNYNVSIVGGGNVSDKLEITNTTTGHQISAAIGIDIKLGVLRLRPEIAFAVTPGIAQSINRKISTENITVGPQTGGGGWAIFPGFTLAIATPRRELTEEEEQEEAEVEKAAKKKKGDDGEDDEDEDEDAPRRPAGKKKAKLDDDEEENNARKKRRPAVDEDESD